MNCFEVFHFPGVSCPKFDEHGNTEDEIAVTGCQYPIKINCECLLYLLVATDPAYTRSGAGMVGGAAGLNTEEVIPTPVYPTKNVCARLNTKLETDEPCISEG